MKLNVTEISALFEESATLLNRLAEVEKERDELKNTLKLIGNLLEEKLFAADDAVFVIKKTLAKLEG